MVICIEFLKYGGLEVFQVVEFMLCDFVEYEIQVENKVIGINYIDIYVCSGFYLLLLLLSGLGIEVVGIVSKVGYGVMYIKVGDWVVYVQLVFGVYSMVYNVLVDKVVVLLDVIFFEQVVVLFFKGLMVWYLLCKIYEIKFDEMFLFYVVVGGVGLIVCQWVKVLGVKFIGIVGSVQKVQCVKEVGVWQVINYCEEFIVEWFKVFIDGKKVVVVYDLVGKDIWEVFLDCLQCCGLMVSFGNFFGLVIGVNLGILN